jgi:hypothetical protein
MNTILAKETASDSIFVDREQEIEFINNKIKALKNRQRLFEFMVILWGIPGMGKTRLLKQVVNTAEKEGITALLIDCQNEQDSLCWVQEIADRFFQGDKYLRQWTNDNAITDSFIEKFLESLESRPFVLLFDNVHWLDKVSQGILETILLKTIPNHNNQLLIVVAGRLEIRWDSFELRRRSLLHTLTSFPKSEHHKLLSYPHNSVLGDKVFSVTRGYPLASALTSDWLKQLRVSANDLTESNFVDYEQALVIELSNKIIKTYILNGIEGEQNQLVYKLLRYLSPLRRFDEVIIVDVLTKLGGDFVNIDVLSSRAYIRLLAAKTYLIKWDRVRQAYAIDEPVRLLLNLELKYNSLQELITIHDVMRKWYQSKSQTVLYLIEQIFHSAWYYGLSGLCARLEHYVNDIGSIIDAYSQTDRTHFYEELAKDEELAEALGMTLYNVLLEKALKIKD